LFFPFDIGNPVEKDVKIEKPISSGENKPKNTQDSKNRKTSPQEESKGSSKSPGAPAVNNLPAAPAAPAAPAEQAALEPGSPVPAPPGESSEGGMVQMGGGLPDLPARPAAPIRQAMPSMSASLNGNGFLPQRVPNLKQASKPQLNIPAGSDLGMVGKIGVIQMSHKSSAADIHANVFFWIYIITFLTTFILIKRK
jgi:hypothetical protein